MFNFLSRLPVLEKFIRFWRIFRRDTGRNLWGYILISFLVTLTESVGIGLFFPLMNSLQNTGGPKSEVELWVDRGLALFGLSYNLQTILLCLVGVFFVKALIQLVASTFQSHVVADYLRTIATKIYVAICGQKYQSFLTRSIGSLGNATVNETNRASVALVKFATLFPSMITISVFSLLALRVDWALTLGVLGFGGGVLLIMRLLARFIRRVSLESTAEFNRLNELALQSFNSFKYLRATMGVAPLEKQVGATIQRLSRSQFLLSAAANLTQIINEPVAVLLLCAMFWHQTLIAHQPLSHVVVLAVVFYRLIKEVMIFQGSWHGFTATMGSIEFVSSVIDSAERGREPLEGKPFTGIREAIRLEDITFSYGDRNVLQNCSFSIPRNAMVALVGESGSGKSTIVDLITGILRPSSGRVLVDGVPLSEISLASYRARLGYVTQEPALFSDSIANNISFWDEGDPALVRKKVEAAAEEANCSEFIGLEPFRGGNLFRDPIPAVLQSEPFRKVTGRKVEDIEPCRRC
ncbi:MAG: ATP-binding cassette domain-containing protein, partial [Bdellovibrionota bacterium]